MATNIKSLYVIFAIISIASIVASGTSMTKKIVCAPNDYGCCITCAIYGLHGKCYKNKCCCSVSTVQGASNRDFCLWPPNLAFCGK
ncbi:unnamed protein product [Trifolium pratense]|uniref:Uncharacterized protein n=1 Tax=Trifolium pratense TaxID=57577 RepID=A0ACB0K902_TRIPR|nr:unnamed protein product [Trifolium pratense]